MNFGTTMPIVPVIAAIVGITLIVIVVLVVIQMRKYAPKVFLKDPVDLYKPSSPVVVDRATTASMSATYTLSFYVKLDAVPDMRASATPLLRWPGAWDVNYNPAQETLVWTVYPTGSKAETIQIPRVPMQRWTQVSATFEGRSFDFYINGELVLSHILTNLPPAVSASVTIVPGGIMGQIAHAQIWSRRLTVHEVRSNYQDTSDSQGRPYFGPDFFKALNNIQIPNLFCPSGKCSPAATASQTWEFPYA
jgi:hypothetical protein